MTSTEKIEKNWTNYPELNTKLFEDVGEKVGGTHSGKDPVIDLFAYWDTIPKHPMAFLHNPFRYQTVLSATNGTPSPTDLHVNEDLTFTEKLLSAPTILCMYADGDTTDIKPPKKHNIKVKEKNIPYELVGFLSHIKAQVHYVAYIRRNNQWYRCNDIDKIEKIDDPFDTKGIWNHKENDLDEEPHALFYAKQ